MGVEWSLTVLIVVLICISLMTNDVELSFHVLISLFYIFFEERSISNPLPIKKNYGEIHTI